MSTWTSSRQVFLNIQENSKTYAEFLYSIVGHVTILLMIIYAGTSSSLHIPKKKEPLIATLYEMPRQQASKMDDVSIPKPEISENLKEKYKVRDVEIPLPQQSSSGSAAEPHTSTSQESASSQSEDSGILSSITPRASAQNTHAEPVSASPSPQQDVHDMDDVQEKIKEQKRRLLEKRKVSMDWMAMFPSLVASQIQKALPDYILKQKVTCQMRLRLTEDGTLLEATPLSGDEILCVEAQKILNEIGHFDVPELIPEHAKHLRDLTVKIGPWFLD